MKWLFVWPVSSNPICWVPGINLVPIVRVARVRMYAIAAESEFDSPDVDTVPALECIFWSIKARVTTILSPGFTFCIFQECLWLH